MFVKERISVNHPKTRSAGAFFFGKQAAENSTFTSIRNTSAFSVIVTSDVIVCYIYDKISSVV